LGFSVQLAHVPKETSWDDVDEHGYIKLKSAEGKDLIRVGGFQHNRLLRSGGSWDAAAVAKVCEAAKDSVPAAA